METQRRLTFGSFNSETVSLHIDVMLVEGPSSLILAHRDEGQWMMEADINIIGPFNSLQLDQTSEPILWSNVSSICLILIHI